MLRKMGIRRDIDDVVGTCQGRRHAASASDLLDRWGDTADDRLRTVVGAHPAAARLAVGIPGSDGRLSSAVQRAAAKARVAAFAIEIPVEGTLAHLANVAAERWPEDDLVLVISEVLPDGPWLIVSRAPSPKSRPPPQPACSPRATPACRICGRAATPRGHHSAWRPGCARRRECQVARQGGRAPASSIGDGTCDLCVCDAWRIRAGRAL